MAVSPIGVQGLRLGPSSEWIYDLAVKLEVKQKGFVPKDCVIRPYSFNKADAVNNSLSSEPRRELP